MWIGKGTECGVPGYWVWDGILNLLHAPVWVSLNSLDAFLLPLCVLL